MTDAADDEQLATALGILCVGRQVTAEALHREPAIAALHPSLAVRGNASRLHRLLYILSGRGQAILTIVPEAFFTIRESGEDDRKLAERHAAYLIAHYPDAYLDDFFEHHLGAAHAKVDQPRYQRAAKLAREDARLYSRWYPDGMPEYLGRLTPAQLAHFGGYVAALRLRAEEYATAITEGRLRQELRPTRLPCQAGRPDPAPPRPIDLAAPRWLGGHRTNWLSLWIPLTDDMNDPVTVYLLHQATDQVAGGPRRVVGIASLPFQAIPAARLFELASDPHHCCPEVSRWGLVMPAKEGVVPDHAIRFHLTSHRLPTIPTVRPRRLRSRAGRSDDALLQPLGFLATAVGNPWEGLMLWGDGTSARAWEQLTQRRLVGALTHGRRWSQTDGLIAASGRAPVPATEEQISTSLATALPYTIHESLRQL